MAPYGGTIHGLSKTGFGTSKGSEEISESPPQKAIRILALYCHALLLCILLAQYTSDSMEVCIYTITLLKGVGLMRHLQDPLQCVDVWPCPNYFTKVK
jgi:hypothetical protein